MKQKQLDISYLKIAAIWSENSTANRLKVGAVIVKDKAIISDGYNGTPSGFDNVCEDAQGLSKDIVLHAEANAITKVAKSTNSTIGATIYSLYAPCVSCALLIVQAEISRCVYAHEYRSSRGLEILKQAGIEVEQIKYT